MSKPLKYTDTDIGFQEVPDEVSLLINISNCPYNCEGCHSPYLQEDVGLPLTLEVLDDLISSYKDKPITCICFLGDGGNIEALGKLIEHCHNKGFLTCLYTGSTRSYEAITASNRTLDFIKIGRYYPLHGGLDSLSTNQLFLRIHYSDEGDINWWSIKDLTYKFRKK